MSKGLDISVYQDGIDISKLKDNMVDFLILRAGYTGWGGTGTSKNKDRCFEKFYSDAKKYNIPVGAYWYSCANTYDKGVAEAKYIYENCLKGKQFEYPIYIDVEDSHHQTNKKLVTDAILGFCKTLEDLGYYVGIYANQNYFDNYIDTYNLTMYDKWLALWKNDLNKPAFKYGDLGMWQYSSSGNVNGYRVDTNICYKDYPSIIKEKGLNGYPKGNIFEKPTNDLDKYTNKQLAEMVWQGKFGNGEERKKLLGDRYDDVQKLVNIFKYTDKQLAEMVWQGKFGNGEERKKLLGDRYDDVQKLVNRS